MNYIFSEPSRYTDEIIVFGGMSKN